MRGISGERRLAPQRNSILKNDHRLPYPTRASLLIDHVFGALALGPSPLRDSASFGRSASEDVEKRKNSDNLSAARTSALQQEKDDHSAFTVFEA